MSEEFEPSLAYAGTSGNVNVDTSRDATIHADMEGITNKAQRYVLSIAEMMKEKGVTVSELRERDGSLHHGRVSAALTNLHIAGRLVALKERRGHCGVYVLPECAGERERRVYRPNRKAIDPEVVVGVLLQHEYITPSYVEPFCRCGWVAPDTIRPIAPQHRAHLAQQIAEALS